MMRKGEWEMGWWALCEGVLSAEVRLVNGGVGGAQMVHDVMMGYRGFYLPVHESSVEGGRAAKEERVAEERIGVCRKRRASRLQ